MKKSHRSIIIITLALLALVLIAGVGIFAWQKATRVKLSPEFYQQSKLEQISADDLGQLAEQKKSFLVFVSQPNCRTADDLRKIIQEYLSQSKLTVFETAFSELKTSNLAPEVKFYPSVIIFQNGKVKDFLRADASEDAKAYTTLDGFADWLQQRLKT